MPLSPGDQVLSAIRAENLAVYRASPIRLKEDVSQEAQISNDYRGRLVYELLQNADDAMSGHEMLDDKIVFRLTDTDLWVGNSGRPLDEADVKGLCGIGASRKGDVVGRRRASIGHKGMGFKSVLEITDAPEVVSENFAFRMSADLARGPIEALMEELDEPRPKRVPVMRFPQPIDTPPPMWKELQEAGIRTLFRFPLRADLTEEQRALLADRLLALPVTTILFLKHLERVEVSVETEARTAGFTWAVTRERHSDDAWRPCPGLLETGVYTVRIQSGDDDSFQFLLAHDADVEIGQFRGGLDTYAWEGVEVSEVSAATLVSGASPMNLPDSWRYFHVFLPTAEHCPYHVLVNGAFVSDLSRQEIRVGEEENDYNRFLMRRVAALFRHVLAAQLEREGAMTADVLRLLDRDVDEPEAPAPTAAGQALYGAMRQEFSTHPFLPADDLGERLALEECVVPPLVSASSVGEEYRRLLPADTTYEQRRFPAAVFCGSKLARIAVDHGALSLPPGAAAHVLASDDLPKVLLVEHHSGALLVDPVLKVLQGLWEGLDLYERDELAEAVRAEPLFPIGQHEGVVERVATEGFNCFYPPRTLRGTVPLDGLQFLMQDLCWGALTPTERTQVLKDQLVAWQALFELRDFKFPDVMRASVLPALELDVEERGRHRLEHLQRFSALAAVCQLSGRTPDPARPLRYERLGSNRALFNLSRLPVPCRSSGGGEHEWRPAYQVYLGEDWLGESSIERVLDVARTRSANVPEVPLLAAPEHFDGLLAAFRHLEEAVESEDDEEEVGLDEDEEAAPDQAERDRWLDFLTWIGVNRALRPVHFHDVEDRATGWLNTKDLARPTGQAFQRLAPEIWDRFRDEVRGSLGDRAGVPYFYRVHDLEHIVPILKAAAADESAEVGGALFNHLASNWPHLERFTRAQVALVPPDKVPSMRTKPPRAYDDEVADVADDLWVVRLKDQDWCPTTRGPRRPGRVWLRTTEVDRRFSRQGADAGVLLPLLDVGQESTQDRARGLAQTLGIRAELTSSTFTPADARGLIEQIRDLYSEKAESRALTEAELRRIIRPVYRNLMELLPGTESAMSPAFGAGILKGAPLLVQDGHGSYRFEPSDEVFQAERSGTRERIGSPEGLWTFVLEAERVARAPLTTLFGVRILEDALTWSPEPGDLALEDEGLRAFREGVRDLAPYILSRLGAERQETRLAAEDGRRLRAFVDAVLPVDELSVRCRLGERELGATASRDAFVEGAGSNGLTAFVKWRSDPWPPVGDDAEALATAISDLLEVGHFEAFLALISATHPDSRLKLLRLAGAPIDIEGAREALSGPGSEPEAEPVEPVDPSKTPGEATTEEPAKGAGKSDGPPPIAKTPLFRPDQLLIDGVPIPIVGESHDPRRGSPGGGAGGDGGGPSQYGGHTDLDELDQLGMYVALTFELRRLQRAGMSRAKIFDPKGRDNQEHALIFDVSTWGAVSRASEASELFREAMTALERREISAEAPGFDILTLHPDRPDHLDRLIELKSSGVHARLQEMSWNEWKAARTSALRKFFYLYLVGNLRSDLGDVAPFLRAVHDPFESIWADEVEEKSSSRKVQLRVTQFKAAEHLDLAVRRGTANEPVEQA